MSFMAWLQSHRRSVLFLGALLAAGGLVSIPGLPVSLFPIADFPRVVVAVDAGDRAAEQMVLLTPHYTAKPRQLTYADVPMTRKLQLRFGLADTARAGATVHLKVQVNDKVLLDRDVKERGLNVEVLDTAQFSGRKARLSLTVTSPAPAGCIFGVDGSPLK